MLALPSDLATRYATYLAHRGVRDHHYWIRAGDEFVLKLLCRGYHNDRKGGNCLHLPLSLFLSLFACEKQKQ
jgi:hypothetical protein